MPPLFKQKRKTKDQPRTANGKYNKKVRKDVQNSSASGYGQHDAVIAFHDDNGSSNSFGNNPYDDSDLGVNGGNSSGSGDNINDVLASDGDGNSEYIGYEFLNEEEWGDDDDSRWDDLKDMEAEIKLNQRLKEFSLVWRNDNQLKKTKRRPYKIGKTPKSTYYDKYDPNGSLTKTAADTTKITNFFNINDTQSTKSQILKPDILEDSSSDSESEIFNPYTYQIAEKIKNLKEQLEKQHNQLTVVEYNHKRAIFEYLTLLNSNNRRKRVEISLEVVQKIYISSGVQKARKL